MSNTRKIQQQQQQQQQNKVKTFWRPIIVQQHPLQPWNWFKKIMLFFFTI